MTMQEFLDQLPGGPIEFTAEQVDSRPDGGCAGMDKYAGHWKWTIKRGLIELSGYYSKGSGHLIWRPTRCIQLKDRVFWSRWPYSTHRDAGRPVHFRPRTPSEVEHFAGAVEFPPLTMVEVLESLAMDCQSVYSAPTFEIWAGDLGYDTDSRKAEKIWRECVEMAIQLQGMFGLDKYAKFVATGDND